MTDTVSLAEYVEERIHAIFLELAEGCAIGALHLGELSQEDAAGIPFVLAKADNHLTACWRRFLEGGDE